MFPCFSIAPNECPYLTETPINFGYPSFDEALLFLYSSDQLISSELTPEEAAEKKEDIEKLRRAYESLDAEDRELIYLLYLCREPLTEKQVASVLHISQQAVNKRKKRIMRKMKSFWL